MKNKILKINPLFDYITTTSRFKTIFLLYCLLAIYGSVILSIQMNNFFDGILMVFQFPIFNICFFALLFLNTIYIINTVSKQFEYYIIRLQTKRNYLSKLLKIVLVINIYMMLLFLIVYFAFYNLFHFGAFAIYSYQHYDISNAVYSVFYLFRYLLFAVLLSLIIIFLKLRIKENGFLSIMILFLIGFLMFPNSGATVSSFQLLIWRYFSLTVYESFGVELMNSLLFLILLELCISFSYYGLTKPRKRMIS